MAKYTPPRTSTEFKKGERGEALVKFAKKNGKVIVGVKFVESENTYTFRRTKSIAKLRPGRWNLQLNSEQDQIWNFSPWSGQYKVRVEGFAAKEGERPTPVVKEYKNTDGGAYETVNFTVLLEIVEPANFSGITIPYFLRYNFREAQDEEGRSVVGLPDRGSRTKQLVDFLDMTGAWTRGPMKWQDNVLPAFETRILREAREFNVIVKDGWIDTLYTTEEPEVEDDWDDSLEVKDSGNDVVEESDEDEIQLDWEE